MTIIIKGRRNQRQGRCRFFGSSEMFVCDWEVGQSQRVRAILKAIARAHGITYRMLSLYVEGLARHVLALRRQASLYNEHTLDVTILPR